jgi:hypothetical protein
VHAKIGVAAAAVSPKTAKTPAVFGTAQVSAERQDEGKESNAGAPNTGGQIVAATTDAHKDALAPPGNTDALMAIVMVRPDLNSVAELAGKTIAIDQRYSASSSMIRTAMVAAGATEAQVSEGPTGAMIRLSDGEVSAAVIALLAPEVAEAFPAIAGYKVFQVPLSPRSVKPAR